jgi:hypothetical protein
MGQIIDAFAEYERALIRARTRAAMGPSEGPRTAGRAIPTFQQVADDGRTLMPHHDEQQTLRAGSFNARSWRSSSSAMPLRSPPERSTMLS